jgi:protease-4
MQPIVIQNVAPPPRRNWVTRVLVFALVAAVAVIFGLYSSYSEYFQDVTTPSERYHSGEKAVGATKIVLVEINGTIMPPFTDRILKSIEKAERDDKVVGIVLAVDSPGGLVADSHQIYHKLVKLRETKPIVVTMKRMAASGGYYVAMGAGPKGKIFAEPTTWTGSIGVIIPRYDISKLSEKVGVDSDPLKTGEFKDALSPFREMSESEKQVWTAIMDDAYQRFLSVIDDNRSQLDLAGIKALATGQVYTAEQAKKNGLIDEIGFEEDAIEHLKTELKLEKARIVTYKFPTGLMDVLMGNVEARNPHTIWKDVLEATVPRAMYYCSWAPALPSW